MSCYRCTEKFSLFKKEIGCGNCGFGFCSKCCQNKINVPKKENRTLNVCLKCFQQLKSNETSAAVSNTTKDITPPKNFLKLQEANSAKQETSVDNDLANRLEKLNDNKKSSAPNESELAERLRKLQGREQDTHLSNLPSKDKIKTSDDLIKKLKEELEIESKYEEYEKSQLKSLESRLKKIQEFTSSRQQYKNSDENNDKKDANSNNNAVSSSDRRPVDHDPSDELVKKMLQQVEQSYKSKQVISDDEPWCCICNDDAHFRCIDCDDDFYCKRCFKETHKNFEYRTHRKKDI